MRTPFLIGPVAICVTAAASAQTPEASDAASEVGALAPVGSPISLGAG